MFAWHELLDFWFGPLDEYGLPDREHRERWFRSSRAFDQEIRRRFISMVLFASENGLEHWRQEPGGRLAEILLLDQFTRHIYRGGELAFSNDRQAASLCLEGLGAGVDHRLVAIQRAFFYMPLQHAEKLEHQDRSVELYERLAASEDGPLGAFLESFLQSARDHRQIIQRFGRFPHRNRALKRRSTPEEQQYLEGGGASYGQG
ncbi:Uncharacterized conserved protein, DUF924 family [Marinobacter daqiaonensis]|uniref:Uncharacterized conserved protein, DUF924 family n=1 Tax=Marinobacter daqiaonensis TaxID=650891 RepID=A0A1I6GM84_9GAMM|nr:DUF924 family protein [Marinobacter daqiaonensis]SFR43157.1 Uncharacterized conserved protein, DUF924 family [Marinobacter daqiaonensis]